MGTLGLDRALCRVPGILLAHLWLLDSALDPLGLLYAPAGLLFVVVLLANVQTCSSSLLSTLDTLNLCNSN